MRKQRWDGPAILVALVLCTASSPVAAAEPPPEMIAKGKALTEAGDCGSCHTADPSKPFAGGKRIATPFGGIYSANLTPDRNTGLGLWSDEDFRRAMRFGVRPDGANYYPAFPYPHFSKLTRDDIFLVVSLSAHRAFTNLLFQVFLLSSNNFLMMLTRILFQD